MTKMTADIIARGREPTILPASLQDCALACSRVSEFMQERIAYPLDDPAYLQHHLHDKQDVICLAASLGAKIAGCLIGYRDPIAPGSFYGWIAGVINEHRHEGLLSKLHESLIQNLTVSHPSYQYITARTWRKREIMISAFKRLGYELVSVEPRDNPQEDRLNVRRPVAGPFSVDHLSNSWAAIAGGPTS